MKPQDIAEYKQQWMSKDHYEVKIHSDLRNKGKEWCKTQLFKEQWHNNKWTNVYETTFFFERQYHAQQFAHEFVEWLIDYD